jgi:hypothetical protein
MIINAIEAMSLHAAGARDLLIRMMSSRTAPG